MNHDHVFRDNGEMIQTMIAAILEEDGDGEDILTYAIVGQRANMSAFYISNIPDNMFTDYVRFLARSFPDHDENTTPELAGRDVQNGNEPEN